MDFLENVTANFYCMQAHMANYGLPKVSPRPAIPNPSTPCGRAIPKTVSQLFLWWPDSKVGGLRPSPNPLDRDESR
jgi:hypothetical protein